MKLAHTPLHRIVPGDRVVSHTGMSGRIAAIYRPGDPAPVDTATDGSIDEPRILILWGSGKWSLAEHHTLEKVRHDIEAPRDALIHGAPKRTLSPQAQRLSQGFRAILEEMGPPRGQVG